MHIDYFSEYALYTMQVSGMENLGELIRLLRKERKLSQQDLAKQYGMSRSTISGIENNTISEIGLRKVEAILNGFGYELTAVPRRSTRPTLDTLKKVNFHG
ncbi:Helix-turn-helix [Pseudomonas frederiksbergensis]|jgi:transcriptional regulator with XRE-family HTH domain|uniref:Helix-turn-helix n=2 Tax=Pseudomonas TaxID=286 RepID=A0A1H4RSS1_9PSED|nr:Helix-turn-helix [Pseudomonas frederiksbergensis]